MNEDELKEKTVNALVDIARRHLVPIKSSYRKAQLITAIVTHTNSSKYKQQVDEEERKFLEDEKYQDYKFEFDKRDPFLARYIDERIKQLVEEQLDSRDRPKYNTILW